MNALESFPINSVARNSVWAYDAFSQPHFDGAPVIVERARSHRMPDFGRLPESADIAVELYGGAVKFRLDGATRRVYTGKFDYVRYHTDEEARHAFLALWSEVERLVSSDAVARGGGVAGASTRMITTTSVKPSAKRSLRRGTSHVSS